MQIEQFEAFEITATDDLLLQGFTLLLSDCRLSELSPAACRATVLAQGGCYLWVMRVASARYKIYLGQTRSILKRVTDYAGGFQVHSPNDFKLRFFEESMREFFPFASLDLYFAPDCEAREADFLRQLRPLINTLPPANEEERSMIRDAFRAYYRSSVSRHLAPRA